MVIPDTPGPPQRNRLEVFNARQRVQFHGLVPFTVDYVACRKKGTPRRVDTGA